jgi:hypothetical protein
MRVALVGIGGPPDRGWLVNGVSALRPQVPGESVCRRFGPRVPGRTLSLSHARDRK